MTYRGGGIANDAWGANTGSCWEQELYAIGPVGEGFSESKHEAVGVNPIRER